MANDHSADLDEMTVEDENHRNSETDDMRNILGNFMQSKEETLEELVGGFMYLTMEDVLNASNPATVLASKSDVFRGEDPEPLLAVMKRVTAPEQNTEDVPKSGEENSASNVNQTEDIEEEILEDNRNTKQSSGNALFRHRPASLTKFDNFVLSEEDPGSDEEHDMRKDEDGEEKKEGEKEENWMPTSRYMASFAAGNAVEEEQPQSTKTIPRISDEQTANPDSSHISTPSSQLTSHLPSTNISVTESSHNDRASGELSDKTVTISKGMEPVCNSSSAVCDNDVEAPAWALNPGEAEEEISALPVKHNISVIEISTIITPSSDTANGETNTASQEPEQDCSDKVVPFELDENYDYDNVAYTPKFTQAEMNYLASFLPHNS